MILGSSDIVPASEDEIARVIAETQAKLQAAAPLMSATDAEYDQVSSDANLYDLCVTEAIFNT